MKNMICYFSGTGNSKYVACRISEALADSMLVKLYTDAEMEMPYGIAQFLPFCVVAGALTLFFFFIFSFIVKWGSRNCKHSPFL